MNLKPEPVGFMLLKKTILFLTLIFIFLFVQTIAIFASEQDNKVAKAFKLFDQEKYREAEPLFKNLIDEKPELLMLYYYYGACRTENKNYSENDLIHLLNANPNEAPVKVNYYLGIQYQALNNWEQAIKYYNKFKLAAPQEEQTELEIAEKIQQCFNRENPYSGLVIQTQEKLSAKIQTEEIQIPEFDSFETTEIPGDSIPAEPDTFEILTLKEQQQLSEPELEPAQEIEQGNPIEFRINNQITYYNSENFQTEDGKKYFDQGIAKQNELDEILIRIEKLREEYMAANSTTEKNTIGEKILTFENVSFQLKEETTQLLFQAEKIENDFWKKSTSDEIEDFIHKVEMSRVNRKVQNQTTKQILIPDSTPVINPLLLIGDEPEPLTEEKPQKTNLVYKIQIGAFSRGLPSYVDRLFKKLALIRKIENYTDENGVVVYTTGNLTNLEDAMLMQKQVRQEGVEDAYVVPYFNGKRITLEQAKKIESGL